MSSDGVYIWWTDHFFCLLLGLSGDELLLPLHLQEHHHTTRRLHLHAHNT